MIAGLGGTGHHPGCWKVLCCLRLGYLRLGYLGTIADFQNFVVSAKKLAVPELVVGSWRLELCRAVVSGTWVDLGDIAHHPECWRQLACRKEIADLGCFWHLALPAKKPAVQQSFLCCYYLDHCGLLVLQKADLASILHSHDRLYPAQWWKTWSRSIKRMSEDLVPEQ